MLVEDDIMILDTTRELLKLLGHQVFASTSGATALEILSEQKGLVDLVMLDLSLPDMDGNQLLPRLAAKYPTLKVVICSGSLPDELDYAGQPIVRGILNKPFELRELRSIISNVLLEQ